MYCTVRQGAAYHPSPKLGCVLQERVRTKFTCVATFNLVANLRADEKPYQIVPKLKFTGLVTCADTLTIPQPLKRLRGAGRPRWHSETIERFRELILGDELPNDSLCQSDLGRPRAALQLHLGTCGAPHKCRGPPVRRRRGVPIQRKVPRVVLPSSGQRSWRVLPGQQRGFPQQRPALLPVAVGAQLQCRGPKGWRRRNQFQK